MYFFLFTSRRCFQTLRLQVRNVCNSRLQTKRLLTTRPPIIITNYKENSQMEGDISAQSTLSEVSAPSIGLADESQGNPTALSPLPDQSSITMEPTPDYIQVSMHEPLHSPNAQPILLILDLNGTLIHRSKSSKAFHKRPYLDKFLSYIFEHFYVMVWSSAQPVNVDRMVDFLLTPSQRDRLVGILDRTSFSLSEIEYKKKSVTIKNLDIVWTNNQLRTANYPSVLDVNHVWTQQNTVLLDDSPKKAQLQPFNAIHLPEFDRDNYRRGDDCALREVIPYLGLIRSQNNVSAFIRRLGFDVWCKENDIKLRDVDTD